MKILKELDNKYIIVNKDKNKGFWVVNTVDGVALFRDKTHKLESGIEILDLTHDFETLEHYLTSTYKYVKTLIKDRKIIFSSSDPYCSYSVMGLDRHHPENVWHCDNKADVVKDGVQVCKQHIKLV